MQTDQEVRIDKYLWAVRIYKTRSQATEACKKGRVFILDLAVKPSRAIKINDIIQVKKPPVVYSYKVLGLLGKRLSATAIKDFVENITTDEEMDKLKVKDGFFIKRDRGTGRPTKKERRIIDKLKEEQ